MEKIIIDGGRPLNGRVKVDGMKNAAGAVILASIVTRGVCEIENLPRIKEVSVSLDILREIGADVSITGEGSVRINTENVTDRPVSAELMSKMRASYYLAGAMLARFGRTNVVFPGGCDFGERPVDQHIKAFRALGADAKSDSDHIEATATSGLHGADIYFDCVTVGGTINAMIAAVGADGMTVINNAAREPHVVDVANFLNTCGAKISGAGTNVIKVRGGKLHGCTYDIIPDMLEAGTFMVAAAATHGDVYVDGIIPRHIEAISTKLSEMGVLIEEFDDGVRVSAPSALFGTNVKTMPYPGFPTDMQPLMAVLMCLSAGKSEINETIYDKRFRYVEELRRMGARITSDGHEAQIIGTGKLHAATVRAVDLRAGAAMIIAGLAADGRTEIEDIHHIERGYSDMIGKLRTLGASIRKVNYTDV